jgi:palmitoyltransferase ZDHHC13/17
LNSQDYEGLTALHLACMSGNSRVVKRLLLKGADKNIKCLKQRTALDVARESEFSNIEKMLV